MIKLYLQSILFFVLLTLVASINVFAKVDNKTNSLQPKSTLNVKALKLKNDAFIESLTLIAPRTNEGLFEIEDGMIINLMVIETSVINIRANANPEKTGSVKFKLSGPRNYEHIENTAPYALFQNIKDNYFAWRPEIGTYSLTAIPYSESNGEGDQGEPLTVSFTIIDGAQVTNFFLVNADDNSDIMEITDGMEIDLEKLPTQNINFRAKTVPEVVGSVELSIKEIVEDNFFSHIENAVPYALFSDHQGDYYGRLAENGHFYIEAAPFERNHGNGKKGFSMGVAFKMTNALEFSASRFLKKHNSLESFSVYPNPGRNALNIYLQEHQEGDVTIKLYDMAGHKVYDKHKKNADGNIMLDVSNLESRPYIIQLVSESGTSTIRWFKE